MAGKATRVSSILSRRIAQGDYMGAALPSERSLAEQEGVSYMTARKAVQNLIGAGLLTRTPTGRLMINRQPPPELRPLQIACILPSFPSSDALNWRLAVDRCLAGRAARAKFLPFSHWDDPTLRHALERCDGAFIYPLSEQAPKTALDLLRAHRVVVLDQDFTAFGLPSVRLSPVEAIDDLLDHLTSLGHRSVACLNVQPHDQAIIERIAQWRLWCARRNVVGALIDQPVRSHQQPATAAYEALRTADLADAAIFATTMPGAMGAIRAAHDRGMRIGRDVSLCTLNDEGLGTVTVPSITAAATPDPDPWLHSSLAWMTDPARPEWQGPMLMQPERHVIAVRESSRAFTLIELLVVTSIIAILAAMMFSAIGTMRNRTRITGCMSNLRQIGLAYTMYAQDNDNVIANKGAGYNGLNPDPLQFEDYITTTDRTWRCTEPILVNRYPALGPWPYLVNWRATNATSIKAQFPAAKAVPIGRVARPGEAMIVADLSAGCGGGFHRGNSCAVMIDAHVIARPDSALTGPTSDVTSWNDPGPTIASEYINLRPLDQKLKGYTY